MTRVTALRTQQKDPVDLGRAYISLARAERTPGPEVMDAVLEGLAEVFEKLGDPEGLALAREGLRMHALDGILDQIEQALEDVPR